jgi:Protein of unknown function (DUF1236)
MARSHYEVLFAGLTFRKKHATKHRGPLDVDCTRRDNRAPIWTIFNETIAGIAICNPGGGSLRRTAMKLHLIAIVATAALTSGIGVASAADNQAMSKTSTPSAMQQSMAKDSLSLTPSQQRTAWRNLSKQASSRTAPSSFTASVGTTIPGDIALRPMPAKVAAHVSSLKPYDYTLLQGKLLIVNPNDKKVVDVITRRA